MRARVLVPFLVAASCAALADFGDGFGGLGDNGGFDGATGLGEAARAVAPSGPPSPTFDLVAGSTTPNDLSDSLVVNGTPLTLVLACDAQGVSGTSWACRDSGGPVTLAEAGTGGAPTSSPLTPFEPLDSAERMVNYAASGRRHDAPTTAVADLTTDDLAVEYVGRTGASGAVLFGKGIAGVAGWEVSQSGTNSVRLFLRTASTSASVTTPTNATTASHQHSIIFVDRSEASTNGSVAYMNGAGGTGVDLSARSGSLSNASTFAVGAVPGGAANVASVATIRIWRCAGCFAGGATNPTQWAPIARERAARAFGLAPTIAAGTAAPSTMTRAATAFVDVFNTTTRHLYLVGQAAPRTARRTHSNGTVVVGHLSEPSVSNLALQSQTLGTTWTAITTGDNVLADAFAGADLTLTGDNVDGDNTAPAEHGLRQAITLTAATHTFSAWARSGSQTRVALRNQTIANGAAWFDLTTCTSGTCTIGESCAAAVGTVQAGVTRASAERWPIDTSGDGVADVNLCRVAITYTGTAAPNNHDLLCAPADNTLTYLDGDAAADCGFWGVRVEAFPTATSYVATTTVAGSRNADDFRFDGASHYTGTPSTMDVGVLCPSFDTAAASTFISVGTGTTNYARLGIDAAADRGFGEATVTTQQWNIIAGSGDVSNGVATSLRQTMATNAIEAFVGGSSIGTDTSATLPTVASSFIYLGSTGSTAAASACLLSRVRLWSSSVTPGAAP